MKIKSFLKECREKDVVKKLSIYAVSSWLLIQVVAVMWEPLGLPAKTVTFLILILLIGFPIYIFIIWRFQIEPIHKKEQVEMGAQSVPKGKDYLTPFQKIYYSILAVISVLVILISLVIIKNNFVQEVPTLEIKKGNKIGVLQFGNNTGNASYDIVGKMAADWIVHGITEKNIAQVVSPEIVTDYTNILKASISPQRSENVLQEYFQPAKIISGNYYLQNGKLLFQCTITDGKMDKTLITLESVDCSPESPLDCIEALKQRILGYLITEDQDPYNLEQIPPNFEAYEYLLTAKTESVSEEEYLDLLNKAIDADRDYFEPKVLRVAYYFNQGVAYSDNQAFKKSDSLLKSIGTITANNKRQANILNGYRSLLQGANDRVYSYFKKEYDVAPFDMKTNASFMVIALQYVYRPEEVDSIFNEISMQTGDLNNCSDCIDRLYIKARSDLELERYKQVINFIKPLPDDENFEMLKAPLLDAYVRIGDFKNVDSILEKNNYGSDSENGMNVNLRVGKECLLADNREQANKYFNKVLQFPDRNNDTKFKARANYYKEDYIAAEPLFEKINEATPNNEENITLLSITYEKNGKKEKAAQLITKLDSLRSTYQYGSIDYQLARYSAALGKKPETINYLLKAVASGYLYGPSEYQNDPHFKNFLDSSDFDKILTYWH
tara:strand:- start:16 stop:2016 length:2001 start_codon:yes stop_codon:yes gene_type:complete